MFFPWIIVPQLEYCEDVRRFGQHPARKHLDSSLIFFSSASSFLARNAAEGPKKLAQRVQIDEKYEMS